MIIINSIKKANLRQYLLLFFMLCISQIAICDDKVQNSLNLDYFRTPEASAFKKYGEESVNEYTGTADVSVPLYTIKSKDIEIPLVLRYDASGIKVEQEASWVGLGWNLMVGGCINYVCAGGHDQLTHAAISDKTWMEYLTTIQSPSPIKYFDYTKNSKNTWMETVNHSFAFETPYNSNLSQDMQNYLMWGYGERDFYSVNVLGKSFKFFIDPATLRPFIIGQAGEDYKVESDYDDSDKGIGHQPDVAEWTITDANGYVYTFNKGDRTNDGKGFSYTFCWYLTEIKTPLGEKIQLTYTKSKEWGRNRLTETYSQISPSVSVDDNVYGEKGYTPILTAGYVSNSFVEEIKTSNQIVTFNMSDCQKNSGKQLNSITIKSRNDNREIKKILFSYGSFQNANVGGNYAPATNPDAELRLKLNNVKEVALSTSNKDTLTTSFSYNSEKLPSKRSCAQDYWGYYNGKTNANNIIGYKGHTMIPTLSTFMTSYSSYVKTFGTFKGADRNPDGKYMQAAMLNKVVYPTGGYTLYEYEPNTIKTNDYKQSLEYEAYLNRGYDININKYFSYTPDAPVKVSNAPYNFTLTGDLNYSLSVGCSGDAINGSTFSVVIVSLSTGGTPTEIPVKYKSSNDLIEIKTGTLHAGNYQLIIGAPSTGTKNYGISCQLKGNYTKNEFEKLYPQKTFSRAVGGLRVKKILNYDNNGDFINYTTFDYNNSGILLDAIETIEPYSYTMLENKPIQGFTSPYLPQSPFANSKHSISGCRVTQGQSRLAAFYAACNPGIVGYSKVTKCKYDANGKVVKYIETTYRNHAPEVHVLGMDFYKCLDNGKVQCQEIFDANKKVVLKVENKYLTHELQDDEEKDRWYSTNMVAIDHIRIDPSVKYIDGELELANRFQIWKYPYILSRVDLIKTTTTEKCSDGKTIVKTKEFKYKNNNGNLQVYQTDENTSLTNQTHRTIITYSSDGIDVASRSMKNQHRLNEVVKTEKILVDNGKPKTLSREYTKYSSNKINEVLYYLPNSYEKSIGDAPLEERAKYSYDEMLNVRSITVDGFETVYLWSYNGQYPIAKIEGLTYSEVESAIGASKISSLLSKSTPTSSDRREIRTAINGIGGYITTYSFIPLVGLESECKPNGQSFTYKYDGFGRLTQILDYNDKIISSYEYNYKK